MVRAKGVGGSSRRGRPAFPWWGSAGNVGPERISEGWEKLGTPIRHSQWKTITTISVEHPTADLVRWLLDFAASDLQKLSPEDWVSLYIEALFFSKPPSRNQR